MSYLHLILRGVSLARTAPIGSSTYYGQDRFDHMFYRLVQNGLTRRDEPRAPFVDEPLRAPDYERKREIIFRK